jgi:hypothetical protein
LEAACHLLSRLSSHELVCELIGAVLALGRLGITVRLLATVTRIRLELHLLHHHLLLHHVLLLHGHLHFLHHLGLRVERVRLEAIRRDQSLLLLRLCLSFLLLLDVIEVEWIERFLRLLLGLC